MSRTYREIEIGWCKQCDKPINRYRVITVKSGRDICSCDTRAQNPKWKITKVWDHQIGPYIKPFQQYWNRKHRTHSDSKIHEMVKDYNTNGKVDSSYTFPIQRNQAKWDAW